MTKYDPKKAMIALLIMSTLMAAMVDEVISTLFIVAIVFEYVGNQRRKLRHNVG
jgi:hypothetical protein